MRVKENHYLRKANNKTNTEPNEKIANQEFSMIMIYGRRLN